MGCSYYNGTILPNLPDRDTETYPYALILDGQDEEGNAQTVLWLSSAPFTADADYSRQFHRDINSVAAAYVADMTYYRWSAATITETDSTDADVATVNGTYVWSNHGINLFNAVVEMPQWDSESYPYLLILQRGFAGAYEDEIPRYEAWYSTEPFTMNDANNTEGQALTQEVMGPTFAYTTDTVGHAEWVKPVVSDEYWGSWTEETNTEDQNLGYGYYDDQTIAFTQNYWANHDITGTVHGKELKANNWYQLLCFAAAEPEAVVVEAPSDVAITGGNAVYDQNGTASDLICTATAPEGGTLSYVWYRNGSVAAVGNPYTPSTEVAGVFEYYVIATNSQYGDSVSAQSATVTVTVNAVETEITASDKPVHVIGYVLRLCGVPMAEMIAMMLCRAEDTAEAVPVAYSYNGYVLPVVPEAMKDYPYLRLRLMSGTYQLEAFYEQPVTTLYSNFLTSYDKNALAASAETPYGNFLYSSNYGDWYEDTFDSDCGTTLANILWANFDILTSEGAVYLAASEAVPVYAGAMCSYNGTTLPVLPEWDEAAYPYALIHKESDGRYTLYASASMPQTSTNQYVIVTDDICATTNNDNNHWWGFSSESTSNTGVLLESVLWANFDVPDADGTVYLAASEPV